MNFPLRCLLLSCAALAAACATADTEPATTMTAPAPFGETMARTANEAVSVESDWLVDRPLSTPNNRFRVKLVYRVAGNQAALAEQCVKNHWTEACNLAQQALDTTNFRQEFATEQSRLDWQNHLQQQFTTALFPCVAGEPLATVTGIVVRLVDQGAEHPPLQNR
jgi:hypothetical protein